MQNIDEREKPRISIIAAIGASDRGLGKGNDLLYKIPDDLARFRDLTRGHPVIMGRKTWESLPEKVRPLPERLNIVITRQAGYEAKGATVAPSVEDALATARAVASNEIFIIGGGEIYKLGLPHANRLYLTLVEEEKEADVFFPEYEKEFTKILSGESREWNGIRYRWVNLERL